MSFDFSENFKCNISPECFMKPYHPFLISEWWILKFSRLSDPKIRDGMRKKNFYLRVQSKINKKKYSGICCFSEILCDEQEPIYMSYSVNKKTPN